MENDEIPLAVFLDLRKAFDCINRKRLLRKLSLAVLSASSTSLIKSYFDKRLQCVRVSGLLSEIDEVEYGVPQGSILGPLLFIFYINDMNQLEDPKYYNNVCRRYSIAFEAQKLCDSVSPGNPLNLPC